MNEYKNLKKMTTEIHVVYYINHQADIVVGWDSLVHLAQRMLRTKQLV